MLKPVSECLEPLDRLVAGAEKGNKAKTADDHDSAVKDAELVETEHSLKQNVQLQE